MTEEEIIKLCNECYLQGFQDAIKILQDVKPNLPSMMNSFYQAAEKIKTHKEGVKQSINKL